MKDEERKSAEMVRDKMEKIITYLKRSYENAKDIAKRNGSDICCWDICDAYMNLAYEYIGVLCEAYMNRANAFIDIVQKLEEGEKWGEK